jgi:hypothetical protein
MPGMRKGRKLLKQKKENIEGKSAKNLFITGSRYWISRTSEKFSQQVSVLTLLMQVSAL